MEFIKFNEELQKHFKEMCEKGDLFETTTNRDELWQLYLDSFPEGTNPIYKTRREYDCNCCKHFIKMIGGVVAINDDYSVTTLWDFSPSSPTAQAVVKALSNFVKKHQVADVFLMDAWRLSRSGILGTPISHVQEDNKTVTTFNHFHVMVPNSCVGDISTKSTKRASRTVFKRSIEEIGINSTDTILELINQGSLYRGEEWKRNLELFRDCQLKYMAIDKEVAENFFWRNSVRLGDAVSRIKNHSIGTLLQDIEAGTELDTAVRKYESVVAPTNYKRPKAIVTQKMIEDAKSKISELGYLDSLERRFATMDDITINNILFANRDTIKQIKGDIFSELTSQVATVNPRRFSKVEEINIQDFFSKVLPTVTEIGVLFENRLTGNLMSLIAPKNTDSKTMFKWNNNFSWAYKGNVADSMKERVKAAGGKVDGVLRFSIQWNDLDEYDGNDLDAHCCEPNGRTIYYVNKRSITGGELDVDIICPQKNVPAVENITYPSVRNMPKGDYIFSVHGFSNRGGKDGVRAEIEFDGQVYEFNYSSIIRSGELIKIATVTLQENNKFSITPHLESSQSTRQVWGLQTNQFVPVSMIMNSPNYWDEQSGIGNKHYFFMLKKCVNPDTPNGFYNEFLDNRLMEHKRVFEILGSKMAAESCDNQLSGLGFSTTVHNEIIVKVKGSTERLLKIKI